MNTDRSLLRHLLTAALVMFLICGFTITPIAGAELTSSIYDAYDVSVTGGSDFTAATEDTEDDPVDPDTYIPAAAIPETCAMIYDFVRVVMAGTAAIEIGTHLRVIPWDGLEESWNNFVLGVQDAIVKLLDIDEDKWVYVSDDEGQGAFLPLLEEYYSSDGDKRKDDKWYFEANLTKGKIQINLKRLNAQQALKVMDQGKNIMTLNKELAIYVVKRFEIEGTWPHRWIDLEPEKPHKEEGDYYYHLHYGRYKTERLHCWMWNNP